MRIIFITLLSALLLTGCTTSKTDIYYVCKYTDTDTFVTDGQSFYQQTDLGLTRVPQDSLMAKPALNFKLRKGSYKFKQTEIPTVYNATLKGLEIYINTLHENFGGDCVISYADPTTIAGNYMCDSFSVKFKYNTTNELRLYAIDKQQKYITPPYIIGNVKIKDVAYE